MTDRSFLFDVRWRCLNSQFPDWLKIRSYHTVCQISTFSYYSHLNFFFKLSPTTKERSVLLFFNFQQPFLEIVSNWQKKQTFFIMCFPPKNMCSVKQLRTNHHTIISQIFNQSIQGTIFNAFLTWDVLARLYNFRKHLKSMARW